jgi:hypothetical protein
MGLALESFSNFIHASEALLEWYRQLPKFTQISMQMTEDTIIIRDYIRATESDPYSNMKRLIEKIDLLEEAKAELESFMDRNERELISRVLELTNQSSIDDLIIEIIRKRDGGIVTNSKLVSLAFNDEQKSIIDGMSEQLIGVARTEWSDATQELFLSQVKYEWEMLMTQQQTAVSLDMGINLNTPLSKKSQTIYVNVKNMLKYAGKDVSTQEIKQLLLKLFQEF